MAKPKAKPTQYQLILTAIDEIKLAQVAHPATTSASVLAG